VIFFKQTSKFRIRGYQHSYCKEVVYVLKALTFDLTFRPPSSGISLAWVQDPHTSGQGLMEVTREKGIILKTHI
jgi:hypothetical protein